MSDEISLIITNTSTFIKGRLKSEVYKGLKKALGYMPEDAFFAVERMKMDPDYDKKPWLHDYDGQITTVCYNKAKCRCTIKKEGTHFPTGLASKALEYFKKQYIQCKVYDKREKVEKNLSLKMNKCEFEARDYQTDAINKACEAERGLIKAATGCGKTLIGSGIIAEINVSPFIFYVTSKDLLKQARDELQRFVCNKGSSLDVGVIGDGKCDIKDVNVMTVQTAVRACGMKYKRFDDEEKVVKEKGVSEKNKKEIKDLILSAKGMIFDECVSGDTIVYTEQGKVRIDEIDPRSCKFILSHNGQKPVWSKITDFFRMGKKEIIEIELESCRRIKCTRNHPLMTDSGWKMAGKITKEDKILGLVNAVADKFCQEAEGKDIYSAIKSKKEQRRNGKRYIKTLSEMPRFASAAVGRKSSREQQLLRYSLEEKGKGVTVNFANSMIRGRLIGISNLIRAKSSLFLGLYSVIRRYFSPVQEAKIQESVGIIAWIKRIGLNIRCLFCTDFIHILKKLKIKVMETVLYIIILDAIRLCLKSIKLLMGVLPKRTLLENGLILSGQLDLRGGFAMTEATLRNFNYIQRDTLWKKMKLFPNGFQTTMDQFQSTKQNKNIILLESYQKQVEKYSALLKNTSPHACNTKYQKIVSIKEVASEDVYDITVKETHCFFANDILVHNCQHVRSDSAQVISDMSLSCRYRWGLSATPFRDQGDDILVEACFGKTICDISASYLIRENYLVKPDIYFVPISNMRGKGFGTYATAYKEAIVNNPIRNDIIVKVAKQMMDNDRVILILCKQIKHGKILESLIPDSVFIHGSHSSKIRKAHLDKIRERKASITIASTIFDEGINVKSLDTLILAGSGKSKTRALQRVGRILRKSPGKEEATVIDFMDNCKYMLSHSNTRRKIYATEPEFSIDDLKMK